MKASLKPTPQARRRRVSGFRPGSFFQRHAYALISSLGHLARRPWASLMTVTVLGVALALPAGLLIGVRNVERLGSGWLASDQAAVFLAAGIETDQAKALHATLERDERVADARLVPPDEGFDSLAVHSISGLDKKWPLWLSVDFVSEVRKMSESGKCWDPGLSHVIGTDEQGNYFALGYIRVTTESAIFVRTAMRVKRFPADISEVLSFIVEHELFLKLKAVLAGEETALPVANVEEEIQEFRRKYTFICATSFTRGPINHAAL